MREREREREERVDLVYIISGTMDLQFVSRRWQSLKVAIRYYGCLEKTTRSDISYIRHVQMTIVIIYHPYLNPLQLTEVGTMNIFVHWINENGGIVCILAALYTITMMLAIFV